MIIRQYVNTTQEPPMPNNYKFIIEYLAATDVFTLHPARKSGKYRISRNGQEWQEMSMTAFLVEVRRMCKRVPKEG